MKRVLLPLAAGFEEIEAVTVIDILRRARVEVVVAAMDGAAGTAVEGSHRIAVTSDVAAAEVDIAGFDALVLPGGMPGTRRLAESPQVREWVRAVARRGGVLGAICAAPTVLEACGVLAGRRATSHPNHAAELRSCRYEDKPVVKDGNVITSRGAGTSVAFAAALVTELAGADAARDILARIQYAAGG